MNPIKQIKTVVFLAAIFSILPICISNAQITSDVADENLFDIAIYKSSVHESALEVRWYPSSNLTNFIVEIRNLIDGSIEKKSVSGQNSVFIDDIFIDDDYAISVRAVDETFTHVLGTSPEELWRGEQTKLAKPANIQSHGGSEAFATPTLNATLHALDSNNFPFIFTTVSVDTGNSPVGTLTTANFTAFEDGRIQTDFFAVTPPDIGGGVRILDFIFLIDNSGSMGPEQQQVKANVSAFVDGLAARQIDVRLGLVRFGQTASGGQPIIMNNGNMTGDINFFKSLLNQLTAAGAIEPGIEAVFQAATTFSFRPGSQRHFLLITDEDSDGGNLQQSINTCLNNNIIVHTAVDCNFMNSNSDYCNSSSIRGRTGGLLSDVIGPYDAIFDRITTNIGNTYIVRYRTDNPVFDAQQREVRILVNAFSQSDEVIGFYTPGAAPLIVRTQATKNLSNSAQIAGVPIKIAAQITDAVAPFIQNARLFYRRTGTTNYSSLNMTAVGNNIYEATISGTNIITPGLDYYITATDGQATSSDPSVDPNIFPYQIAILPNLPPAISHTPVTTGIPGQAITIAADVTDNTDSLANVALHFRGIGSLLFTVVPMHQTTANKYEGIIPGSAVTNDGLEYFIRAIDNFNLAGVHGPHRITVDVECPFPFFDDFEDGVADGWAPLNPARWTVVQDQGDFSYFLNTTDFSANGDALGEFTVIDNHVFDDFTFTCQARSAEDLASNENADFDIVFGYQDALNYYYVMFNSNPVFTEIFKLVNGTRTSLANYGVSAISDNSYHNIEVKRDGNLIEVKFDNALIMSATDGTFTNGKIGLGSFNDSAYFDDIQICATGIPGGEIKPVVTATQVIGTEFWVDITVSSVQDLFGLSFDLNFTNTTYLDVVTPTSNNVIPGPFLGSDVVFIPVVDEAGGKVSIGISRKSGQGGVNGSGVVIRIKFNSMNSTPAGTQATFSLSNITANDPAGNTINMQSSSSTIVLEGLVVWPGDTDNNGIVNQADVLPIGLNWNRTGPARQNATINWVGQVATPWTPQASTYADANGSGNVNQADVLPIGLNWNRTHSATLFTSALTKSLLNESIVNSANLQFKIDGDTNPGDNFYVEIHANDVTNLFGISFEVVYAPPTYIDPLGAEPGSWIGSDVIFISNTDTTAGKIGIGISRKSGQGGVDGSGMVSRIMMQMSNDAVATQDTTFLSIQNVQATDPDGNSVQFDISNVTLTPLVTKIETPFVSTPDRFALHQNYPNPFNPETTISYQLPVTGSVELAIYNILGQKIRTLFNQRRTTGYYQVRWDGRNEAGVQVPSGVYLYRLVAHNFVQTQKMLLLR